MDKQKELDRLKEGSEFWKPKAGQFKVKALSELEDADDFVREHKDEETGEIVEQRTPQAKIKILVDGSEKVWTMGTGKTLASSFGQLLELDRKNGGSLLNKEFTVVVKFDGNKNDYTIVD
jgi:hypothetical protein